MIAAADLLSELYARDVKIERHGERLTMRAPGAPPAELLTQVRDLKADLLTLLPDCDAIQIPALRDRLQALAATHALPPRLVHTLDDADVTACHGLPETELQAYLRALVRSEDIARGMLPPAYTQVVHCAGCGPVLLWAGCPPRLKACPWCFRRKAGKAIPRPSVRCGDCRHSIPDSRNPSVGVGECAAGAEPLWPTQLHSCALMRPRDPD